MKVNIEELREIFKRLENINKVDLKDIEFFENGKKINIPEINIEKFKFKGLVNHDFIKYNIHLEDFSKDIKSKEILEIDSRITHSYTEFDGEEYDIEVFFNLKNIDFEMKQIFKSNDKEDILKQIASFFKNI